MYNRYRLVLSCLNEYKVTVKILKVAAKHISNQHGVGSKPTRAILLYSWEKHLQHFPVLGGLGKQF